MSQTIAIPQEAWQTCTECGGNVAPDPNRLQVQEDTGQVYATLYCISECQKIVGAWSWRLTDEEFEAYFGHPLGQFRQPLPDGVEPPPIALPDELWSRCNKRISREWGETQEEWERRYASLTSYVCEGLKQPDLEWLGGAGYNYVVSCRSTCDTCGDVTAIYWEITPDEYRALYGHDLEDFVYVPDPNDPDDFVPQFSWWHTGDRTTETTCRDLNGLISDMEAYDVPPGKFTLKDWSNGHHWDMADYLRQHNIKLWSWEDDEPSSDQVDDGDDVVDGYGDA